MLLEDLKKDEWKPTAKLHSKATLPSRWADEPDNEDESYFVYSIEGLTPAQRKRIFNVVNVKSRAVPPAVYSAYRKAGLNVEKIFGAPISNLGATKNKSYDGNGKLFFAVTVSKPEDLKSSKHEAEMQKYAENYLTHLVAYVTGPLAKSATDKANASKNSKYEIRKYEGDDVYSWALFRKGDSRPIVSGMSRTEALWRKENMEKGKE